MSEHGGTGTRDGPARVNRGRFAGLAAGSQGRVPRPMLLVAASLTVMWAILAVLVATEAPWVISLDEWVHRVVLDARTSSLDLPMKIWSGLASRWTVGGLLLGLAVLSFVARRGRRTVLVLWLASAASAVLEAALKGAVGRPRPDVDLLTSAQGPAFPSGHVLTALALYGVLAALITHPPVEPAIRRWTWSVAAVVILGIAYSRLYLGVHWFTDVIGSLLIGIPFVVVVVMGYRRATSR